MEDPMQPGPQGAADPRWLPRDPFGEDSRRKSPLLAAVLSAMPGLGQIYIGYYGQGFVHIVVVALLIAFLNDGAGRWTPFFGIFLAFFWLYNIVDAGRRAALYNYALAALGPMELPQMVKMPRTQSSLAGGLALVAAGTILLTHTRFGFSFDWLERWWPMGLVLMGGYLVTMSLLSRTTVAE